MTTVPLVSGASPARRSGAWLGAALALGPLGAAGADTVRFCFTEWRPYLFVEAGRPAGISIEILTEAARRAGLEVTFEELPWNRCLHEVRTGAADAVVDAAKRPFLLQGPVSHTVFTNTFWVRAEDAASTFELEAFRGKTVGLVDGYSYPDGLLAEAPYAIDYAIDDATNARKLAAGRVDAIVADLVSTRAIAEAEGLDIRPLPPAHSVDPLFPSFHAARRALHERIDRALAGMMADGSVDQVYRRIVGTGFTSLLREVSPEEVDPE